MKEYVKNRRPVGVGFVAMALDCAGGWGPAMMKYFREASSEYSKRYMNEDRQMRYVPTLRRGISLAICKARRMGFELLCLRKGNKWDLISTPNKTLL